MKRTLLTLAAITALLLGLPAVGSPAAASPNFADGGCSVGGVSVSCDVPDAVLAAFICPITNVEASAAWKPDRSRTESFGYRLVDQCGDIEVDSYYETGSRVAYERIDTGHGEIHTRWTCPQNPWTSQAQPRACTPLASWLYPPSVLPEGTGLLAAKSQHTDLPLSVGPLAPISRQTLNGQLQNAIKALPPFDLSLFPAPMSATPQTGGTTVTPTAQPLTSAPVDKAETPSSKLPTVKVGASGDTVTALQYLLRQAGQDISADGDFGDQTDGAVRAFQKAKGLTVDGIVGDKTWNALFVTVKKGSQGDAVSAAQTLLAVREQDVAADGDFGEQTDAAVRAFQTTKGLTVDGVVGTQTWTALIAGT